MLEHVPGAILLSIAVSLVPASLRWWWGRSLTRHLDDPVIAERLAAHTTRVAAVAGGCAVLLMFGWPTWFPWIIPLLILAQSVAGYPLRKALYGETWSVAAALAFQVRLGLAVFGFWALLGLTPWLASMAGSNDWIVSVALAVLLLAWSRYFTDVTRTILRARPIGDAPLLERFDVLVARSRIPPPRFECVDMRGGVLPNALALPSLRRSAVLFTDTLLSRLTADEIVAVCAHELAHLEYYDRTRLRRLAAVTYFLIAAAAATAALDRVLFPVAYRGLGAVIWPGVVFIALAIRGRSRQRNETASDRRAVELTGDAEAVATALTALYVLARVPRRWDQRRERTATHPSLARRLRDIRGATPASTAGLRGRASFQAASGTAAVTFEPESVSWQEHPGAIHRLEYSSLAELRLHASSRGAVMLVAVERQGRRWQMAPRTEDTATLQSVLDDVDGRLAHEVHPPAFPAVVTRLVTLLASLLALAAGQFAVGFIAMFAAIAVVPALLNGAAWSAFVAAAMVSARGTASAKSTAVLVAAIGVGFLALGRARRGESSRLTPVALTLLVLGAGAGVATILLGGIDPIRLHQAARGVPAGAILTAALGGALWTWRERTALRYAAIGCALAAAGLAALGTTRFLDLAGRDPFLAPAPQATSMGVGKTQIATVDVPFEIDTLRLSPNGVLAAALPTEDDDAHGPAQELIFHAGLMRDRLSPVDATDLAFIDDRRALLLATVAGGLELREAIFEPALRIGWRQRVPGLRFASVSYRSDRSGWVLVGYDMSGRFAHAEGTVGVPGFRMNTWHPLSSDNRWVGAIAADAASALVIEEHHEYGILAQTPLRRFAPVLAQPYTDVRLWLLRGETRVEVSRSRLDTGCSALDAGLVCSAYDGSRTHVVSVALETGTVTPVALLDGRFWATDAAASGWITGWWESTPAAIRLATREVFRPPTGDDFATLVAAGTAVMGTVTSTEEGSRLRVYPLCAAEKCEPSATPAAAR